jgi:hypothetical protein
MTTEPDTGWELVAADEHAADLVATLLELDREAVYTRSEIADRAGVPMKTLYLDETLEAFADAGMLERVESEETEPAFTVREGTPLAAAREFDDAVTEHLQD